MNGRTDYPGGEPSVKPVVGEPATTFRERFWLTYFVMVTPIQVVLAAGFLGSNLFVPVRPGVWANSLVVYGYYSAGVAILFAVVQFLRVRASAVRVGPAGLRGPTWCGRFATVSWASIRRVDRGGLSWPPYAWVFSRDCDRIVSVPLFVSDYSRFAEVIEEYAGPDHPLTRVVRERLGGD